MSTSEKDSDAVLERARVREVTGVFRSRLALDVAAGELLLMGFDRADIDVVAGVDEIYKNSASPTSRPRNWPMSRVCRGALSSSGRT